MKSPNVYFAGSIKGGDQDTDIYLDFVDHIRGNGINVFSEHFNPQTDETILTDPEIHDRDMAWIEQSSAIVAEMTTVSAGAGYEIGRLHSLYKPALVLFAPAEMPRDLSAMIGGAPHVLPWEYKRTKQGILIAKTAIDVFLHDVFYGSPKKNKQLGEFKEAVHKQLDWHS